MKNFLIILFLVPPKVFSQSPIDNWKSYPTPQMDSVFKYNNSDTTWFVTLSKSGKVLAENKIARWLSPDKLPFKTAVDTNPPYKIRGFQTVKKVVNGYLVGYNRGEWGGDLSWYSGNGDSSYRILYSNVIAITEINSTLFLIEGLAHLSYSGGSICQLQQDINNKWQVIKKIDLPSAPSVIAYYNNKLLIIATDDILIFDGYEKLESLKTEGFWGILYPQSAVIVDDTLYLGMRKGIYKFNLKTKEEKWLTPE